MNGLPLMIALFRFLPFLSSQEIVNKEKVPVSSMLTAYPKVGKYDWKW